MTRRRWFAPLSIVLAALLAFGNNLGAPFLVDDAALVERSASAAARSPHAGPLAGWTLALERAFDVASPALLRGGNLALHIVAALLVLGVVRQGLRAPRMPRVLARNAELLAWGTAVLFVAHPLGAEGVFVASRRAELVAAVLFLATIYATLRAFAGGGGRWVAAAVAASAFGVALHTVALTAPFVLLLFSRAFDTGSFGAAWRAERALWTGLAATFVLGLALTVGAGVELDLAYLAAQGRLVPSYFAASLLPGRLVLEHGPLVAAGEGWTLAGAALAVIALAGVVGTRTHPRAAWPIAWCLGILVPTSSLFADPAAVGADHRAYLPLVVVLLLVLTLPFLWFLHSRNAVRDSMRRAWVVIVVVLAVGALGWTQKRHAFFASERAFWRQAVLEAPRNPHAWKRHADLLRSSSEPEPALRAYRRALVLDPGYDDARASLGTYLADQGRFAEAASELERAVAGGRVSGETAAALATALFETGDRDRALAWLDERLAARPDDAVLRALRDRIRRSP
ncbi:MAG: tetratricopeptide repeat protein [Planctomycetota bacterium]